MILFFTQMSSKFFVLGKVVIRSGFDWVEPSVVGRVCQSGSDLRARRACILRIQIHLKAGRPSDRPFTRNHLRKGNRFA